MGIRDVTEKSFICPSGRCPWGSPPHGPGWDGRGPGWGPGRGPGWGPGWGPGRGPGWGPGKGPGWGPDKGPCCGPRRGPWY